MLSAFFQELLQTGIYKRSQGRISRQVTFFTAVIVIALGLYSLRVTLLGYGPAISLGLPGVLLLVGLWAAYRIVNVPSFADFLIAVEAEMNKVSWPTRAELIRGSTVVLITILSLAATLFVFDWIWRVLFTRLGIL